MTYVHINDEVVQYPARSTPLPGGFQTRHRCEVMVGLGRAGRQDEELKHGRPQDTSLLGQSWAALETELCSMVTTV
jgi:hypothetical protein